MNKKVLWLLLASLAANVFLGVAVGTSFSRGPKGPPPRPDRMLEEMASILPSSDAQILRQAMESRRGELTADEGGPPRPFEDIRRVLSAEPFDVDEFVRVNSEFRAKHERIGAIIGEVLTEALPRMSPEGRKRLAEFRPGPK